LLAPSGGGYSASSPIAVGPHEVYVPWGVVITQFDPTSRYATWEYKTPSVAIANHGIAVGDTALYINYGTTLRAISRQTGSFLWQWTAPTTLTSNVVLTDSHLFVGSDSETFAIDVASRAKAWSAPYGGSLAVVGDFLFISNPDALHAFSLAVPEPCGLVLLSFGVILIACHPGRQRISPSPFGSKIGRGKRASG
jgi:PQQ-like domain